MSSANETSPYNRNGTEGPGSPQVEENNLVELIFQYSVIIVGIVGTLANGIVIMISLKQSIGTKMSTSNKLILNQMLLDMFSCMSLILVYGWKTVNEKLNTSWSYLSCCLIESEQLIWSPVISSVVNLVFLTLERYWKIVHNSLYHEYYRNWITVMVISLAWMIGFAFSLPAAFANMIYIDGICSPMNFPSYLDSLIFSWSVVLVAYVIPVLVFVVCYGHILVTMKASFKNFDNSEGGETNANVRNLHYRHQMTLVKTMIIIIISFFVCKSSYNILGTLMTIYPQSFFYLWHTSAWYGAMFVGLLESCIHPFIYGTRFDLVRNYLKEALRKLRCGTVISRDPVSVVTETRFWIKHLWTNCIKSITNRNLKSTSNRETFEMTK